MAKKENTNHMVEFERLSGMKDQLFFTKNKELLKKDKIEVKIREIEKGWNKINVALQEPESKICCFGKFWKFSKLCQMV